MIGVLQIFELTFAGTFDPLCLLPTLVDALVLAVAVPGPICLSFVFGRTRRSKGSRHSGRGFEELGFKSREVAKSSLCLLLKFKV